MKTIKFKCTLLSDIIINQKAATEGNQQTLDFIPGNTFLGVVAGEIYNTISSNESMQIFHSGSVHFGDAHPLIDGKRALRIPASWYIKKGTNLMDGVYIHHGIPDSGLKTENGNPVQVKQQREGFIYKTAGEIIKTISPSKNFAIKSAYDSNNRRAKDKQMFGYQSLQADSEWCFEITLDDNIIALEDSIVSAIIGHKRIGRSSTAQYGLVDIVKFNFKDSFESEKILKARFEDKAKKSVIEKDVIMLYAESRLIFLDEYGQATFTPTIQQLGFNSGKIDWEKSQIRTFQYAPYNNHRKTRDADRCGIEKGSVICIEDSNITSIDQSKLAHQVGAYFNEGFGKILINPEFLAYSDREGKAVFKVEKSTNPKSANAHYNPDVKSIQNHYDKLVYNYLFSQKGKKQQQFNIYDQVNTFVEKNAKDFQNNDTFASQWGTIRSLAMQSITKKQLYNKLFEKNNGYLMHGIAHEKWEGKKLNTFREFVDNLAEEISIKTTVNLAAEMAKKCRRN